MTTYTVHKGIGDMRVVIALDGYGPADENFAGGFKQVGTFEHDVNETSNTTAASGLNRNGDHFLIAGAKEVLRNSGDFDNLNLDKLTYLDQASNAPQHEDAAYSTDAMLDSGGEAHPDVSTQLGGAESEVNDSQLEQGGIDGNQEGSENRQEAETEQNEDESQEEQEDPADGETVTQLKERIALITDKDELQKAYDAEKAREKGERSTAIAAIEARAAELNEPE